MTKELSLDVRFNSMPAYADFGEGENFMKKIRDIYQGRGLEISSEYESTLTVPPIHFLQAYAPDDCDIEELRKVEVPGDMHIEILDAI